MVLLLLVAVRLVLNLCTFVNIDLNSQSNDHHQGQFIHWPHHVSLSSDVTVTIRGSTKAIRGVTLEETTPIDPGRATKADTEHAEDVTSKEAAVVEG